MKRIAIEKVKTASVWAIIFLSIVVSSCDDIQIDPDADRTNSELVASTIYLRSGSSALIDLTANVSTNKPITLTITAPTTNGQLSTMAKGLMQYEPARGSSSARDGFSYSVFDQNNEVIKEGTVAIVVESDSTNLPPGLYPGEDIIFGTTAGATKVVDVLSNDFLGTYTRSDVTVSIYAPDGTYPPYFGTAQVQGTNVVYTANTSFKEADKVVYKVSVKSDPSIAAYGLIYLSNAAACESTLTDDVFITNEPFNQVRIDALANDVLCNAIYGYQVSVAQAPARGVVYVESGVFVYSLQQTAENGFTDFFLYTVSIDGISKTARVDVRVDTSLPGACRLTAVADFIDLTNSTAAEVQIDVLQNDVLCGSQVILEIQTPATHGTSTVGQNATGSKVLIYRPNLADVKDDKITYQLVRGDTVSQASVLIKRVN
jgi:hypothetical protein